jgi:hypothetical protein
MDTSGAPGRDKYDWKWLMKLWTMSVRISECSERKCPEDSPGRTRVEPDDPGDDTDVSAASGSVEYDWNKSKTLSNTSEREHKHSKQRSQEDSPDKARGDPDRPDGETAIQGDL